MGSYSFRSSGVTAVQRDAINTDQSALPIGIKTPLEMGTSEGILKMHYDLGDQVHDNFKNLLLTNFGERLGLYDFGANLRPLTSDWVSLDDFDARAMQNISTAVQRWMPVISLDTFATRMESNNSNSPTVVVAIDYNVPALGILSKHIEVALRVM